MPSYRLIDMAGGEIGIVEDVATLAVDDGTA